MNFFEKLKQIAIICTTVSIGFSFAAPMEHLVLKYDFENDGNGYYGVDASGNNHNAEYNEAEVMFVDGFQGKALDYYYPIGSTQKATSYFRAPDEDALDLNHMTLEVWVFPTSFGKPMNVINKWGPYTPLSQERCYNLNITSLGYPSFFVSHDGYHHADKELRVQSQLLLNEWTHLVATYDGSMMRIYVNGELAGEKSETCVTYVGTTALQIGIDGWGNYPMGGLIDNVRIYDDALTTEELAEVFGTNFPPVADAGQDQAVMYIGTTVQLDGTEDSWDPFTNPLTFQWTITEKPENSTATLNDETSPTPTFVADKNGSYTIELIVNNPWTSSASDEVVISFNNIKPIAVIEGGNVSCDINETVTLSGTESSDENGDMLNYNWQIITKPQGSLAEISDATFVEAYIIPDVAGEYEISLTVNDGTIDSDPAYTTIAAILSGEDAIVQTLQEASDAIVTLPKSAFKNKKMKNTLTKKINEVLLKIDEGDIEGAYNKLKNDILKKTNGCAENESVDKNDWIVDCEAQAFIYPVLVDALDMLLELLE